MGKRSFELNKRICKKCKAKIRKGAKLQWIEPGVSAELVFDSQRQPPKSPDGNFVFDFEGDLPLRIYPSQDLEILNIEEVLGSISRDAVYSKIESRPSRILTRLFLTGRVSSLEMASLSPVHQELVRALVRSKRQGVFAAKDNEPQEWVVLPQCRRRTEENIKFVFNRAIKFMMQTFEDSYFAKFKYFLKPKFNDMCLKDRVKYAFFGLYFGEESKKLGMHIDHFLLPKKQTPKSRKPGPIFTSISKQYLQLISVNPIFLKDLRHYLLHQFMKEISVDIIKKVEIILKKCETLKKGENPEDPSTWKEEIDRIIKNTHMPWTRSEIECSLKDLKSYLRL